MNDDCDNPDAPRTDWGAVDGAAFILDQPVEIPALWGKGTQVVWAEGEALMIAGPQGLGKTTMAGQLVRALLGLGDGEVLGLPVAQVDRVLYLGMDRPRQIARSLGRQFCGDDRDVLAARLVVRPGPPPTDLAANVGVLAAMAEDYDADVVFVDSLKDAAVGLSDDEVGARWNRARQHLLAAGRQLAELHHMVKRNAQGGAPTSVADVYGSTWLTSGCGSVVVLSGEPGDPVVAWRHVKQPIDEVGPWQLLHDPVAGVLTVEFEVDVLDLVRANGADGLTAKDAAAAIFENPRPSKAAVMKARRRLEKLATEGVLVCVKASAASGSNAWFLAETRVTGGYES